MLADDWGWGDVGAYGANGEFGLSGTNTRTPTLDALARNGTLFTDFHVGQSFCAPSRTTFMTGMYPADLSVNTNWNVGAGGAAPNFDAGLPYNLPLPSGEGASPYPGGLPNVPHTLQQSGYTTAHFGKWHLGGCSPPGNHTPSPSEHVYDFPSNSSFSSDLLLGNSARLCHHLLGGAFRLSDIDFIGGWYPKMNQIWQF
jgi:N-acetylgalactosamine-6-sulfatase